MNKTVLILGASGMLGNAVFRYLSQQSNLAVFGTLRQPKDINHFPEENRSNLLPYIDVLNSDELIRLFKKIQPDVIINCIGVIKQLSAAKDPLTSLPINSMLPHQLVNLAALINARIIHMSTDCVFTGSKGMYTEQDTCDATDLYGTSKRLGELTDYANAITLRTSIIGHELTSRNGLIDWFLSQNEQTQGFTSAIFSGFPTVELARIIYEHVIPNDDLTGLYHVSAEPIDKYNLLKLTAEIYNKTIEIIPNDELKIDRSLNSERFKAVTGYIPPSWPDLILKMKDFR